MSDRTVAVSYQNTLPLRAGLARLHEAGVIDMELDRPNSATRRFAKGEFVLGLLPVAAQLSVPEALPFGRFGIVSDGFVGSVGIFSERPLHELSEIHLDHDSRSSVLLARILLHYHWGLSPKLVQAQPGYRDRIARNTGGVIIGDPAIEARERFPFYYDLGAAWKEMTNLPFVFAAWLSAVPLPEDFVARFDAAQAEGVDRRLELAIHHQFEVPGYNLIDYFLNQIHYRLDEAAMAGRDLYLKLGREVLAREAVGTLPRPRELANA